MPMAVLKTLSFPTYPIGDPFNKKDSPFLVQGLTLFIVVQAIESLIIILNNRKVIDVAGV